MRGSALVFLFSFILLAIVVDGKIGSKRASRPVTKVQSQSDLVASVLNAMNQVR